MYNDAIMVAHQFPIQQLGLEIQNLASPHRQRSGSILHISYTYRCGIHDVQDSAFQAFEILTRSGQRPEGNPPPVASGV